MIEIFLTLLFVILIGFICGGFTYFFMYLIGEPDGETVYTRSIFSFYGVWVRRKYDEFEYNLENRILKKDIPKDKEDRYRAGSVNIYKMMGACRYCVDVYITAALSSIIFYFNDISLWWVFIALCLSHISLRFLSDKL